MVYGYARISRREQSIERQIRNIEAEFPGALVVEEAFTGTRMDRPKWTRLCERLSPGDTVVFDSVSRMSRSADEGVRVYFELLGRGVRLVFLKERYIDSDVYIENSRDKIPLQGTDEDEIFRGLNAYFRKLAERQIRIAFEQAQKEVDDLHQRTREGIETARLNGKQIGQVRGSKLHVKKEGPAKEAILKHSASFGGSLSDAECAKVAGVSRGTFYKYKREIREEMLRKGGEA